MSKGGKRSPHEPHSKLPIPAECIYAGPFMSRLNRETLFLEHTPDQAHVWSMPVSDSPISKRSEKRQVDELFYSGHEVPCLDPARSGSIR